MKMKLKNKFKKEKLFDWQVWCWIILFILAFIITGVIKMNDSKCENVTKTIVELNTNKGKIICEIYNKEAPITSTNFLELIESKFYDNLTFHRYEPGFVIQGGDPDGDGTGGSNKTIKLEINKNLTHEKGVLAMARSNDPNSASSQFYITLEPAHFLDGNYAVFGKVIQGMDVVAKLRAKDVILDIRIKEKICN